MSINSDIINGSIASEDQPLVRTTNYSSPGNLPKFESENAAACDSEGADSSVTPRAPVTASNSVNETPKSTKSKKKTKKERSLIPRTKSKKRNENGKLDASPKVEFQKSEKYDTTTSIENKSNNSLAIEDSEPVSSTDRISIKLCGVEEKEEKDLEKRLQNSSTSFLSCRDYTDIAKSSDRNTQENSRKETGGSIKPVKSGDVQDVEEKAIWDLYEIVKSAIGPVFQNSTKTGDKKLKISDSGSQKKINATKESFPTIQGQYEFTLKEISNIWRNTVSLIGSVREHAIQFVEKNAKSVDKEQLTLEAEMLGLAVDVAVSYSKLKMDSLIQMVKKRTKGRKFKKTELEDFMDSKAFSFLYSDDDLAAMARTVRDLNVSLLKGEDLDIE